MGFQSGAAVTAPPGCRAGLAGQGSNQGLWQVLEDSRAVLIAADVPPDGPFPQDEKIKDGKSSLFFTPSFFWCSGAPQTFFQDQCWGRYKASVYSDQTWAAPCLFGDPIAASLTSSSWETCWFAFSLC